jgi:DNA helicase II / ATP-dependent DNA helicase PcrA
MSELLKNLNPIQEEICKKINGPVLILAGAGSGKTRVLTHRIAHLILDHEVDPRMILAVTFTNKAAKEMKKRIEQLLARSISSLWIGTFHSIFARILRIDGKLLGYESNFTIYDTDDSKNVLKAILNDIGINAKEFPPKYFLNEISRKKDRLIEALAIKYNQDFGRDDLIQYIYYRYEAELKKSNAFDFNDLIVKTILLFKSFPEILEKYQNYFRYILVDEYQDTNKAQYTLIKLLSNKHKNLTVVGDEDQSIYKWRGADISNILNFEADFENAIVYRLEENYRSTKQILSAANFVVKNNQSRLGKTLWTNNDEGAKISVLECRSDRDEAVHVLKKLKEFRKENKLKYEDCVILYRTNSQSRVIEEEIRKRGIAYQIIGGQKFYERKEIKDFLAYLRLVVNPSDSIAFKRAISAPARGIGLTSLEKVASFANIHVLSLYDTLLRLNEVTTVNKGTANKFLVFRELIDRFIAEKELKSASYVAELIFEDSGLFAYYKMDDSHDSQSRLENLHQLLQSIKEFSEKNPEANLENFLQEVQLISDIDQYNEDSDKLTLMTLHSSKGLEFPLVVIIGTEDGLLPHENSKYAASEIEEERRLFYVGITRAEKQLVISWCRNRVRGYGNHVASQISPFLTEIPPSAINYENTVIDPYQASYAGNQITEEINEFDQRETLRLGMWVEHDEFGKGQILELNGIGDSARITVKFDSLTKKLIAKYANLQPVEFID